jgi:hypothetical protein
MKRLAAVFGTVLALAVVATPSLAAPNPSGTGQPSQECPTPQNIPGFANSAGFENAESHYAGSEGTPSAANGSSNAVSQYDVACFQVSQSH